MGEIQSTLTFVWCDWFFFSCAGPDIISYLVIPANLIEHVIHSKLKNIRMIWAVLSPLLISHIKSQILWKEWGDLKSQGCCKQFVTLHKTQKIWQVKAHHSHSRMPCCLHVSHSWAFNIVLSSSRPTLVHPYPTVLWVTRGKMSSRLSLYNHNSWYRIPDCWILV